MASQPVFSPHHPHYYGPATFNLLHYSCAALICCLIDVAIWGTVSWTIFDYHRNGAAPLWLTIIAVVLFLSSVVTSIPLIFGYCRHLDHFFQPKIIFSQGVFNVLVIISVSLIILMCLGLEATKCIANFITSVSVLEARLGPLWPLALTVITFFTATVYIWMTAIYTSAADYYRDKNYFERDQDQELK